MTGLEQFRPIEAQRGSDEERATELKSFESLKLEVDKLLNLLEPKISEPGVGSGDEDAERATNLRRDFTELVKSADAFDSMPIDDIRALNAKLIKIRSIVVANLKSFDSGFADYPEN